MTDDEKTSCIDNVLTWLMVVVFIAFFGAIVWSMVMESRTLDHPAEYSMAITGVAGLDLDDLAGDRHPTLSPVFNLTVRISNNRSENWACVPELSTASVFYGDAFLGKGSVGPFCAEPKGDHEGRARAWGQDVVVPRFLRDQLASELQRGDAAVDVVLKMPSGCNTEVSCFDKVLLCKVKVQGDPPCLMSVNVVQSQH
jgi:hypothetical protein